MAGTILFVYGTLKRGLKNHHRIAGQQFLGEAVTEPRYRIIDLGAYPGLILDEGNGLPVEGELWRVDAPCLVVLDRFEGVPELFARRAVGISGRIDRVFAYYWNKTVPTGITSSCRWPPTSMT